LPNIGRYADFLDAVRALFGELAAKGVRLP
jgi:hypothetical protein